MKNNMLVSLIVPIYNVEKFLNKCVDSLIAQTYKNIEIILVDDGSPDNCGKICDEYVLKDGRIRVIHKTNGGLSDARNAGIKMANGKYVLFIDSDDFVEEDFVESMVSELKDDIDLVMCGKFINYSDGNVKIICPKDKLVKNIEDTIIYINSFNEINMSMWGKLFRMDIAKRNLFPVGKTSEDCFVISKYIGESKKCCILNKPLYHYYQNANSISRGKKVSMDFIEGQLEQKKYIEKNFPNLSYVANTLYAYSYITIYNMYIGRNLKINDKRFINVPRQYLKDVLKNPYISYKKKIQYCMYVFVKPIYKYVFLKKKVKH